MSKSPGHRQHPQHNISESRLTRRVQVLVGGDLIADSRDVVLLQEDHYPPRYYFPRDDIAMSRLSPSATTTTCPFKGEASYFSLRDNGEVLEDAAWSYAAPYDEHPLLRERLAFDTDRFPAISIREE